MSLIEEFREKAIKLQRLCLEVIIEFYKHEGFDSDIIKYIREELTFEELEPKLCTLSNKTIKRIIKEYEDVIDWNTFSNYYLSGIMKKKSFLIKKQLDIINNKKFIISKYFLLNGKGLYEVYYSLPYNRISEIVEKLVYENVSNKLFFFKIYEALHNYFPNRKDFYEKYFYYNNLIEEDRNIIFSNESKGGKTFNDLKPDDLFFLFEEIKLNKDKTFEEILELSLNRSKKCMTAIEIFDYFDIEGGGVRDPNSFDNFYEKKIKKNIKLNKAFRK